MAFEVFSQSFRFVRTSPATVIYSKVRRSLSTICKKSEAFSRPRHPTQRVCTPNLERTVATLIPLPPRSTRTCSSRFSSPGFNSLKTAVLSKEGFRQTVVIMFFFLSVVPLCFSATKAFFRRCARARRITLGYAARRNQSACETEDQSSSSSSFFAFSMIF